jgi:hypothetical protein
MREQFEEFRQDTPARFIVPEFSPGRLLEMSCLDPNRCSCLRYAGVEQLPKGWQLTPEDAEYRACRKDPINRLGPLRCSPNNKEQNLQDKEESLQDEEEDLQDEQKRIESHTAGVLTMPQMKYHSVLNHVLPGADACKCATEVGLGSFPNCVQIPVI